MQRRFIDCRDLVGIAVAKRAAGRTWREVRDDLIFYVRGLGADPRLVGDGSEYRFIFPNGHVFYHKASGEYGYEVPKMGGTPSGEMRPVES